MNFWISQGPGTITNKSGLPREYLARLMAESRIPSTDEFARRVENVIRENNRIHAGGRTGKSKYLSESIVGCAVKYNYPLFSYRRGSTDNDGLPLVLKPGCFGDLVNTDVLLTNTHDWSLPGHILAHSGNHTLTLDDRRDGLYFASTRIERTPQAEGAISSVRNGALKGASIGWEYVHTHIGNFEGITARICTKAELGHVALVDSPGCKGSWIQLNR